MSNLLLFTDTETTGIPDFKLPADDPKQPHVASICGMLCRADNLKTVSIFYAYVQREEWSMLDHGPEASRINGIDDDFLDKFGLPALSVFSTFADLLAMGVVFVAHSAAFDYKMIRGELRRLKLPDYYTKTPTFCTMYGNTGICKLPAKNGNGYKKPKLSEAFAHWHPGATQPEAHGAYPDALTCRKIYTKMKMAGIDMTPKQPKGDDEETMAPRPGSAPRGSLLEMDLAEQIPGVKNRNGPSEPLPSTASKPQEPNLEIDDLI